MLRRLAFTTVFALLAVGEVAACSARVWDPDDLVENEIFSSANGRFRAVVRRYEGVPDFTSRLARDVFPDEERTERNSVTVAFYESHLLAEIPIDVNRVDDVFVSDSGRYLVALERLHGGCGAHASAEEPFVTVYTSEGALVGSLNVGDVLDSWDLWKVWWMGNSDVAYGLRHESDAREVFVVKIRTTDTNWVERRIDVADVALLDPKTEIFPKPRVYTTPVNVPLRDLTPPADCAAAFDAPDVVRMQSRHFYGRAVSGPVPMFPEIMLMARVRGPVIVDVVVSEEGQVLCTRASQLPFGGTEAASEAARRWRFTPMTIDGGRVKFAGELVFHFEDVGEEKWRDLMRHAPPFE